MRASSSDIRLSRVPEGMIRMSTQRDVQVRIDRLVHWIQEQVSAAGAAGGVLGMSGGIDSSVVASLCHRALGGKALGLILPCHSVARDLEDARGVARQIGIRTEELDLSGVFDGLISLLPPAGALSRANLKPRLRMLTLYYYANQRNLVVVGTSNGAELAVGYFTKFGDGGADILPIGALLKGEVRQMARVLGIPQPIVDKPPSAGLWEGQTDEEEMGITYDELDRFLSGEETSDPVTRRVRGLMDRSGHKRRPPLVFEEV